MYFVSKRERLRFKDEGEKDDVSYEPVVTLKIQSKVQKLQI